MRELKQRLSLYLARAARGEVIRVTDRGKPKAILGPLPGVERLSLGVDEGWVKPAGGGEPLRVARQRSRRAIAEALDEDRGT